MLALKVRSIFLPLMILLSSTLTAQEVKLFSDLNEFGKIPKTWKIVGSVSADWEHEDFLSTTKGTGILVNPPKSKNGPHLVSGFEHGDMELELEYMIPKGSNSGIYLQGRYEIQIFDSWGKVNPKSSDAGGIYQRWDKASKSGFEGKAPRLNASRAPGLWQQLKIVFEAPKFNEKGEKIKNAKFAQVFHNGVLIHENVEVSGPTTSAMFEDEKPLGPIMIQGDHGPVAIRNIKYKPYGNPMPEIKGLKYTYHKGKFQSMGEFQEKSPDETGELSKVTWDLGHGIHDFAYTYSGNMDIAVSGDYTFSLTTFGSGSLSLNGQSLIEDQNNTSQSGKIRLEKGTVPFKLVFYKNNYPGRKPQLGFFVEGPGIKKAPLHDPNSYIEHIIQKPLYLEPADEPMVIRGFFRHGENTKTHTVAVGEPQGTNYVYDLQTGAVLSLWSGGFIDAAPMWRQRGESQLMVPIGYAIDLQDGPLFSRLQGPEDVWPQSMDVDLIEIKGYSLNRDRRPTFKYTLEEIDVEDILEPEMEGKILTRSINYTNQGKREGYHIRLISADNISDFGDGVYHINQGGYYIRLSKETAQKAVLRKIGAKQELLVPIQTGIEKGSVKYSLIW